MADDEDQVIDNRDLEITEEDAERLLADPDDNRGDKVDRKRGTRSDGSDEDEDDDSERLGESGRRALEAMKEQRKAARAARDQARKEAEDLRRELDKFRNANKSELQRLIDERDALKDQLGQVSSAARRRDFAEEFAPEHATAKQIRLVAKYITGSTDEELEASAEELFSTFAPEPPKAKTTRRPEERLARPKGGTNPEEDDEETDSRRLAEMIRRGR
jgi:CHAD domain-containing protein